MFIDHQQEQWPEWLGMAEFAYNNKVHAGTKVLPFKANSGQDPRMGFKIRKKGKHEGAEKFAERMKNVQEEAKAALQKAQEEMKWYADRERGEMEEYRVGDLVLLSTKDLKYQMVGRRTDKFMEHFVEPYKVKAIISSNAIELELPNTVRIHPVVNISRVQRYKPQVEGQRKCHKLHLAITPRILARFPRSKMRLKALKKTFRTMPKTCQSNWYSSRYQLISAGH